MRRLFIIPIILCTTACTSIVQDSKKVGQSGKAAALDIKNNVVELFTYRPEVPEPPPPLQTSYCYRVMEDIMCYRDPKPGAEGRLVAYQGPGEYVSDVRVTMSAPMQAVPVQPVQATPLSSSMPANHFRTAPLLTPAAPAAPKPAEAKPAAGVASEKKPQQQALSTVSVGEAPQIAGTSN